MIVRTVQEIEGTERDVYAPTFVSKRLILKKDKMGFSCHETTLYAGTKTYIWYKHHLEAVYCVEGEAEIEVLPDGPTYTVKPRTLYALDRHEKHYLYAKTDFRVICIFNPPLTGQEVHDEEGVYPLVEEEDES